jgi:hypothetical protein
MGSRVRNDDRGDDLTPFRVFRANHRARAHVVMLNAHVVMLNKHRFDLGRRDVFAATDDCVVGSTADERAPCLCGTCRHL